MTRQLIKVIIEPIHSATIPSFNRVTFVDNVEQWTIECPIEITLKEIYSRWDGFIDRVRFDYRTKFSVTVDEVIK